jgi:hypothetical protein
MRRAEPVAGLGGILLLVSLFLPWYGVDPTTAFDGQSLVTQNLYVIEDVTGWQAFTVIDVLLALLALPAILVPVLSVAASGPAKPVGIAVIASAIGWIAVLLVAYRLIDSPGDGLDLRYGAWLGLAGGLLGWVGSWLSLHDESTPGAVAPDVPRRPAPPAAAA